MRLSPRKPCATTRPLLFALNRIALLVCAAWGAGAHGQEQMPQVRVPEPPIALQASEMLAEKLSPAQRENAPVFLQGDHMSGRPDLESILEGDAVLRKADTSIRADRLEYYQPDDLAKATGNVRINRNGNVFEGPATEIKLETFEGFFKAPRYQFLQNGSHGEATRADFLDESHTVVHDASYTTCRRRPGPAWMPDWILRATTISLDSDEDVGVATGAVLSFKGVPLLPVPVMSFPLSEKRKSGVLPPTYAVDNVNGVELTVPYYWNIAPNRDATITPALMSQRGLDAVGEFRYLEPTYSGVVRANYMPSDRLRDADRWGAAFVHQGSIATGLSSVGTVGISVNLNRVSDDNYWRDFTRTSATLTQRLLPNDVAASWGRGGFTTGVHVLKWQTLQDPLAPIVPPYDRMPQLTARYAQMNDHGFDWSIDGDFTQFEADRLKTLQPNAQRAFGLAQVSRPWTAPAGFVIPKIQLHTASYQYDAAQASGAQAANSTVPTFSLDSGLVLERDTSIAGRNLIQTLEPRAFYVYTPFQDQSALPNYDTGANDFNFASIYTENAFVGHDKISDNHLVTVGLTTRFLDADTGAQLARFGVAQRLRLEDQRVTLNSTSAPAAAGWSDLLFGASVDLNNRWALDSTVQYNPETRQSVRSTLGARYSPGSYRVVNVAYRYQRDNSEIVDLSWQWPINDLWGDKGQALGSGRGEGEGRYYAVGRLNFSMTEQRLVDTILGVEYDAGCWLGRVVLDRVATSVATTTDRLMFQLEFVGFTRLGFGSQMSLPQNISRYQNLRESVGPSSRFSNYD